MSKRLSRDNARSILQNCHVPLGGNFHALRSETVAALLDWADKRGYRKPSNANGSRGRYWHDYLQRAARRDAA